MSSMTVDRPATPPETGPDHPAAAPRPAPAAPPAPAHRDRPRPLEAAPCAMCGITSPLGLLVPDGGPACADIRWYCKDARSCTERWTTARRPAGPPSPADPGTAHAAAGQPAPDLSPARPPDRVPEPAHPAA